MLPWNMDWKENKEKKLRKQPSSQENDAKKKPKKPWGILEKYYLVSLEVFVKKQKT